MELLPEGTPNNSEVTLDDQQRINEFSTLMTHFDRLNEILNHLESEKEQVDDVSLELELLDDNDLVDYLIGGETPETSSSDNSSGLLTDGCFVKLKQSRVLQLLEDKSSSLDNQIKITNDKINSLNDKLTSLKSVLYAKFGNAINLER